VKNLLDYEHDVEVTAAVLTDKILKIRTVDLFDTLQRFQMDFLAGIAFGESNDFLRNDEDVGKMSFQGRFKHWMRWQSMPTLEHFAFKPLYLSRFVNSPIPLWAQLSRRKLRARLAAMTNAPQGHLKKDLLQKYIEAGEKYKDTINPVMVQNMVSSTISAGFDTTAITVTTIIYYLLKNPQIFAKLQQEQKML
jgi:cytochrome P450